MQTRLLFSGIACAALVIGAAACSDSTAPAGTSSSNAFDAQVSGDLAPSAGDAIANDYTFYSSADMTGAGAAFSIDAAGARLIAPGGGVSASVQTPPQAAAAWISPSCTFSASTGRFACPPVSKNGQTWTVSYALMDANGATQSQYDNVTTASINFIVSDTGATSFTSNGNTFADTVSRRHDLTVSGLAGAPDTVHTWNGTGTTAIKSVRSGQITKVYELASVDTTTAVRFKQPRDINPYPLSGTVVRDYTVTRTRLASDTTRHVTTRRVVVTFNGTANVPMTVGSDSYVLNLDTHKVTKP
jgi:hypothetical protein